MCRGLLFRVAVLLALACGIGCEQNAEIELPPELVGRWTTSAPKYADRYLELRANRTAVFGLGGKRNDVSPIVKVELVRDGDFLVYQISHLSNAGEVYVLSLRYDPRRPGEFRMVNQPGVVWTKLDKTPS